ncbi:hypothetical protein [Actinomycetospora soli]|uniref:hypothetical protein n=1 Tax=Actinomycetospora soli TaxID=2893887 RepID=UPI001E2E3C16|nr:hypothetical protein [Actinomycetospora soli]MCD2188957.1 hypothetical protein [Actinomycetospora soli]
MNPVETFRQADRAIEGVVESIPDDGWERVPAPVFASDPLGGRPVRDAVAHLARDEAWIPSQLAGETMAEAGEPDVGPFPDLARRAREAADAVTDLGATVHSSFGDQTVEEYLWQLVVARALGPRRWHGPWGWRRRSTTSSRRPCSSGSSRGRSSGDRWASCCPHGPRSRARPATGCSDSAVCERDRGRVRP